MKTAFYPGSFDPITNGHLDIIHSALRIVDRLVLAIGVHSSKKAAFSDDERRRLITQTLHDVLPDRVKDIEVVTFDELAVEAARKYSASVIIRGLRDGTDFDYEMQMAGMNATMAPDIQTVFIPASPSVRFISATLVRQIALMQGDIRAFVPEAVSVAFSSRS